MREVVKAPSMAKFSAVLTPPPDSPQSGFFVRGEWNRIGPINYLCFLGAVAKQQLQSFIKPSVATWSWWPKYYQAWKTFCLMKEISSWLSSPLPSCHPRMRSRWEISPAFSNLWWFHQAAFRWVIPRHKGRLFVFFCFRDNTFLWSWWYTWRCILWYVGSCWILMLFSLSTKKKRKLFTVYRFLPFNLNLKQENGKAVITNRIVKEIFTVNCCVIS